MALFKMGAIVATPAALEFCEQHSINPLGVLQRHASGVWGDLDATDTAANIHAVQHDLRVFSGYNVDHGKLWIITDSDRGFTCLLMQINY